MEKTSFETLPRFLGNLLSEAESGKLQLPDFQRSWVWDEDRILDLLASIVGNFPIGAIMTLKTGGEVNFHPRPIQGVKEPTLESLEELLLDGQQRITSIYQIAKRREVVETTTVRHKKISRWFYIDIEKAIVSEDDKSDIFFTVPKDKKIRANDTWENGLDLTTRESEYSQLMFPISELFNWTDWLNGFTKYFENDERLSNLLNNKTTPFYNKIIKIFEGYQIPVISLAKETSKEAVCKVFEKVNTGGKSLDAFELVTAMYAADGHKLRDDWYGDGKEKIGYANKISEMNSIGPSKEGVLSKVASTDFLQVISLYHTRDLRLEAISKGKQGKDLPQVTGKRGALLNLPLEAYLKYRETAFYGFSIAAKFLHMLNIFRVKDLPYQTQIVPLAAILADIGENWEDANIRQKLEQWYWCGVFGELYGSAVDTRIGLDFIEVPEWLLNSGSEPKTVKDANFHDDRLLTMRMRLSAAYKGINILLMKSGAQDFRSGQKFGHTTFFDEAVDIHHVFPKKWCKIAKKDLKESDSIINKTPLSAKTNRIIGGDAPSIYLEKLEKGGTGFKGVPSTELDKYLETHLINPKLLRADNYDDFMNWRKMKIYELVKSTMGKDLDSQDANDEDGDWDGEDDDRGDE